jgi:hypothetical protein
LHSPINRKTPKLQGRWGARTEHKRKTARGIPPKNSLKRPSKLTIKLHSPINRKPPSSPGYMAHERPTSARQRAEDACG